MSLRLSRTYSRVCMGGGGGSPSHHSSFLETGDLESLREVVVLSERTEG